MPLSSSEVFELRVLILALLLMIPSARMFAATSDALTVDNPPLIALDHDDDDFDDDHDDDDRYDDD